MGAGYDGLWKPAEEIAHFVTDSVADGRSSFYGAALGDNHETEISPASRVRRAASPLRASETCPETPTPFRGGFFNFGGGL